MDIELWQNDRIKLIKALRKIAAKLDDMQKKYEARKVGGGAAAVAGGLLAGGAFIAGILTGGKIILYMS